MPDQYTRAELAQKIKSKYPSYAEIDDNELVDKILTKYPQYGEGLIEDEGKTQDPGQEDAIVGLEDTASKSEEASSESQEEQLSAEAERGAKEAAYRSAHAAIPGAAAVVASLPDFLLEPYAAFESTLLGFVGGVADFATQQYARFDQDKYKADEVTGELVKDDTGKTVSTLLEEATPEERNQIWDAYNTAGDTIRDAVDASEFAEQYGSGSISTELASGNIYNAAQLTANQTASGLASLVPFMVPGGAIVGPAVLGSSSAASEFEGYIDEGKIDQDTGKLATMDQIYNASYFKGGAEFATEFVTAGILGRAKKLASGGASKKLVDQYTKGAWRAVMGDAFAEAVAEGATDTAGRFIDKAIFGDEVDYKDATVGFIDSAIVGAIVGGKVSTFSAAAATQQGKKYAAKALETDAQKEANQADAQAAQAAQDTIDEIDAQAVEGSLVDKYARENAVKAKEEAVERVVEREKNHIKTLDDMTKSELKAYAESLQNSKNVAEAAKDPNLTEEAKEVLENKKEEYDDYAAQQYEVVATWPAVTQQAQDIEARLDEEIKLIEMEEAQAAKSEKPNPVGTAKRNIKKKELQAKKKGLNEEVDSKRPTVAEAKTRKRKAKTKPVEVAKDAPKPVKDKVKRDDFNANFNETIKDESLPKVQKDKAWSEFFKVNKAVIGHIANQVVARSAATPGRQLNSDIQTEIVEQVEKKGEWNPSVIGNVSKNLRTRANRDKVVKKSKAALKEDQEAYQEEVDYIDELAKDGILDPDQVAEEKRNIDLKYNLKGATQSLETQTEEGDTQIRKEVEEAKAPSSTEVKKQKEGIDKILSGGTTVDGLVDNIQNNTENLYALLPESAKTGKAFGGLFADGNPSPEVWEDHFDQSTRKGKDRVSRLKEVIANNIKEVKEEVDSSDITNTDAFTDSIEFLEGGEKTKVKMFLPLLSKLKKNFPGTKIIISKGKMIEDFIAAGIDPAKADQVKGYTDGTVVVLNPGKLDAETPIHEFGHIWAQTTRQQRPDLYKKGAELIKRSSEYIEVTEKSKDPSSVYYGKTRDQIIEEAMATAIGKHGEEIFESKEDQSQWDKLRKQIWDWIGTKVGMKKVEDLTLDQFVKLAATEIITGEQFITPKQLKQAQNSLVTEMLEVPVGTTRDYSAKTAPLTELDTHGSFKGHKLSTEVDGVLDRFNNDLADGGWIGWTTGAYGDQVKGTNKFNPKLNSRIEAKVAGMRKHLEGKGYRLVRDPKNPGFHQIRKSLEFSETPQEARARKRYHAKRQQEIDARVEAELDALDAERLGQKSYEQAKRQFDFSEDSIRFQTVADQQYENYEERHVKDIPHPGTLTREEETGLYIDKDGKSYTQAEYDKARANVDKLEAAGFNLSFLEETPQAKVRKSEQEILLKEVKKEIRTALSPPKSKSAYKYTKVSNEVRQVLEATKADLAKKGDQLTIDQLSTLSGLVTDTVQKGRDHIKAIRKANKETREQARKDVDKLIRESQVDTPSYKDRDKFINRVKRVSLSNLLAPASNQDFEGLLYRMLPKGKNRLAARKNIDELLLDPLAKANIEYVSNKAKMKSLWNTNKSRLAESGVNINDDSGVELIAEEGTYNLTKGEVVKAYNYIKDPNLHEQLERGGFDAAKMKEIVDYVHNKKNSSLRVYANGITEVYASIAPAINNKLDEHGRQTFTSPKIDKEALSPEQSELLTSIYGMIPSNAQYTPVTAEGADTTADVDNLIAEGNYEMYSVMDGRLKKRTRGGKIQVSGRNPEADFESYLRGPVRTLSFLDFAKNASNVFGKEQMKEMKLKYGDVWVDSMKDVLKRTVTGRNTPVKKTGETQFIEKLLQRQVGGIMFFNVRSAILQHLSLFNYMFEDGQAVRRGSKAPQAVKEKVAEKMNDYLSDRGQGRTELLVDELFGRTGQNFADTLVEKGYSLTKWGDQNAIKAGGARFMAGKFMEYSKTMPENEAMDRAYQDFFRVTEATQQSTKPERLGKQQTTTLGRYILAFANTPMQYNRKISRAIKDLKGLRNVKGPEASKRKKQAVKEIMWYMGAQNAIFSSLQSLSFAALGLDDGDDEKRAVNWANSLVNTLMRGAGVYGALAGAAKDALIAVSRDKDITDSVVNTIPSVGNLLRNLKVVAGQKPIYPRSELLDEIDPDAAKFIYKSAAALTAGGLPANKALKIAEQVADFVYSDLGALSRIARAAGYERYQIGESASSSPLKNKEGGVWGRANKDGTIEVNPDLSPAQKKQTIQHEKEHQREMASGDLDYDDNSVTYHGKRYERRNGNIVFNGKEVPEGDSSLPWEAKAEAAETPLKDLDPKKLGLRNYDEYALSTPLKKYYDRDESLKFGSPIWKDPPKPGSPEWEAARKAGVEFNKNWYNNPTTQALLAEQAPKYADRAGNIGDEVHFDHGAHLEEGEIAEYWRNSYADEAAGEHKHNVSIGPGQDIGRPGLVAHELTHAGGQDYYLGKEAQKYLGKGTLGGRFGRYLDSPDEAYANLQELRNVLELDPADRDLTPEEVQKLVDEKAGDDQKAYIKNFSLKNVTEALNKVAATDNLNKLYNNVT